MKRRTSASKLSPVQLTWSHLGFLYRVTAWPDVVFETHREGKWVPFEVDSSSDVFAAAAVMLSRSDWSRFLEYVPEKIAILLRQFRTSRLAVLAVLVRCPELVDVIDETPALASFVAQHRVLRGGDRPCWSEISAVFERGGVYSLLEWLGLPSSRDTLDALAQLQDPEIPRRLTERVRELLWNPLVAAQMIHSSPASKRDAVTQLDALAA